MHRSLVIGYGNIDRADDGVAYDVINALRRRLGQEILHEGDTGLEDLGRPIDSVFLSQLAPELMEVLAGYDRIIFVDAHVYENVEALHCCPVSPDAASLIFTHHMTPSTLLAMQKAIYDVEPTGHLVSLRGYDFDFHRGLSADTATLVEPAVEWILQWLTEGVGQIEASR